MLGFLIIVFYFYILCYNKLSPRSEKGGFYEVKI